MNAPCVTLGGADVGLAPLLLRGDVIILPVGHVPKPGTDQRLQVSRGFGLSASRYASRRGEVELGGRVIALRSALRMPGREDTAPRRLPGRGASVQAPGRRG